MCISLRSLVESLFFFLLLRDFCQFQTECLVPPEETRKPPLMGLNMEDWPWSFPGDSPQIAQRKIDQRRRVNNREIRGMLEADKGGRSWGREQESGLSECGGGKNT